MRRNTLALAIAGAFALPAGVMAQSTVQIYGNVRATVENVDSDVPNTGGSRWRVTNPGGSLIGFRGTEALGGGLSAWWQIESNIGGTDGTRADVSTLGGRSTGVGLFGSWGRFIVGNWNSPYKDFAGQFQPFGATSMGGTNSIINNGDHTGPAPLGVPVAGAQLISVSGLYNGTNSSLTPGGALTTQLVQPNVNSFHRRFRNTVGYRGSFSGFNIGLGYQFAEGEQGLTSPDAWAASLYYAAGPLTVGGAYERHNSFASAVVAGVLQDTTDEGWFLGAKYRFGGLELGLAYESLEYEITGSAVGGAKGNLERDAWQLHANYRFGPHSIGGMWIKADDTSGSAGSAAAAATRGGIVGNGGRGSTGADQYTLNYGYSFSKRTEVRVTWARLSNDTASTYDFSSAVTGTGLGTGGTGLGGGLNQGRDRDGYAFSIFHSF